MESLAEWQESRSAEGPEWHDNRSGMCPNKSGIREPERALKHITLRIKCEFFVSHLSLQKIKDGCVGASSNIMKPAFFIACVINRNAEMISRLALI